jgi:hypothetical protein
MAHISVVVPVYKAENCLHALYSRLKTALETITQDFEIVLGGRLWRGSLLGHHYRVSQS